MGRTGLDSIVAELRGARLGLLGFQPGTAASVGAILQAAGCLFHSVREQENGASGGLEDYDALLVYPSGHAPSRVAELLAAAVPMVLIAPPEEIWRNALLQLRGDEILFQPFSGDELLFRIYRAIRRCRIAMPQQQGRREPTILAADDDPNVRIFLKSALRSYGLNCHFASNGREALAMIRELLPELVILDIQMPVITGMDVLRRIREDPGTRNLKVLLLTVSTDIGDIEKASFLSADAYLVKPVNHLLLARRIKRLVSGPAPAVLGAYGMEASFSSRTSPAERMG